MLKKSRKILLVTSLLMPLLMTGYSVNADAADGKKVFKRCMACHTVTGKNKIGPFLNGVVGREAAAVEGFKYSRAMQDSELVWTEENLDKYLENPRKFIPKNKMAFAGLKKEAERKAVIEYMAEFYDGSPEEVEEKTEEEGSSSESK